KAAEEALHQTTQDLTRSNQDLEQFAYVASHDLQEPLRAVAGFMGLLKKQYEPKLDNEGRDYINTAIEGAERMQSLIHDLLAYSRVGTRGGAFERMHLKLAVEGALKNLQAAIAESGAHISCDELPTVIADLPQMTQLMQNLIGNALKFHGQRPLEIVIGAKRGEQEWEISVHDNGIGIEPQYYERIFLIFQRLHSRAQYQGTGIGLAVCKRIVERHNGRIWVKSIGGEGSTFYFTIPDKGENS
ncbi:MAG: ATP-binding protein, partial [Chitinivibrionales bacterium]|nr:ATP-binding protein [Chitinivibrionales bacterium]